MSRANANSADRWQRSILHILAYDQQHADRIATAWADAGPELKTNSLVVLTTTDGNDGYLY